MSFVERVAPRFVDEMPEPLEPGLLYVSLEHGSMMHLCACGCGHEVALPLTPLDWRFTYDGEAISVSPSVGSWSLPCRSHYVIDRGDVRWAGDWSDEEIKAGRDRHRRRCKARYEPASSSPPPDGFILEKDVGATHDSGWFGGLRRLLSRLRGRP